jgi:hypothetical protein
MMSGFVAQAASAGYRRSHAPPIRSSHPKGSCRCSAHRTAGRHHSTPALPLACRPSLRSAAGDRWDDQDLVFSTRTGAPLDAANVAASSAPPAAPPVAACYSPTGRAGRGRAGQVAGREPQPPRRTGPRAGPAPRPGSAAQHRIVPAGAQAAEADPSSHRSSRAVRSEGC